MCANICLNSFLWLPKSSWQKAVDNLRTFSLLTGEITVLKRKKIYLKD